MYALHLGGRDGRVGSEGMGRLISAVAGGDSGGALGALCLRQSGCRLMTCSQLWVTSTGAWVGLTVDPPEQGCWRSERISGNQECHTVIGGCPSPTNWKYKMKGRTQSDRSQ